MKKLKGYTLTALVSAVIFPQATHAATIAPPVETQVKQVVRWFTGLFDNSQQVASNPSVPFISLSNCKVQLEGANTGEQVQNV